MAQPDSFEILVDEAKCLLRELNIPDCQNCLKTVVEVFRTIYMLGYKNGSDKAVEITKEQINQYISETNRPKEEPKGEPQGEPQGEPS